MWYVGLAIVSGTSFLLHCKFVGSHSNEFSARLRSSMNDVLFTRYQKNQSIESFVACGQSRVKLRQVDIDTSKYISSK